MKDRLPSMSFFVGDYVGSISVQLVTLAELKTELKGEFGEIRAEGASLKADRKMSPAA